MGAVCKDILFEVNDNGCHICISHAKDKSGHILYKRNGHRRMHRYIYEINFGNIPSGKVVRHRCDNPSCINPEHLEIGTHQDNVQDRVDRGRSAKGVDNGRAKLTEDDVRYIRSNTTYSNSELSRMFKVDRKVIRDVKDFKTWKHVI